MSSTFLLSGRLMVFAILPAAFFIVGCGGDGASVTGKVLTNGQPVAGGTIQFQPIASDTQIPGKPAMSEVAVDGTYTLWRVKPKDGCVIGKHKVVYIAPVGELDLSKGDPKPGDAPPPSPYDGMVPSNPEVEVKSGANTIDIELVAGAK